MKTQFEEEDEIEMNKETKNKMEKTNYEKAIRTALMILTIDDLEQPIKRGTLAEEINDLIQYIQIHQIEGLDVEMYKEGLKEIRRMNQEEYIQFLRNVFQEIKLKDDFSMEEIS